MPPQSPHDRILWILTNSGGKMERCRLGRCAEMILADWDRYSKSWPGLGIAKFATQQGQDTRVNGREGEVRIFVWDSWNNALAQDPKDEHEQLLIMWSGEKPAIMDSNEAISGPIEDRGYESFHFPRKRTMGQKGKRNIR